MSFVPKTMLYRPGSEPNPEAWNLPVETLSVEDEMVPDALADGWYAHPSEFPAVGSFSLLSENAKTIIEHLPALTREELAALLEAEKAGKARAGVMTAIEKALDQPAS